MRRRELLIGLASAAAPALLPGCGGGGDEPKADVTLVLAAYSVPREAFERGVIPAFREQFARDTGKSIRVVASYLASGAQTRAILGGFEADVTVLSLESDLQKLVDAKVVGPGWRARTRTGTVSSTLVSFAVRPGNPKGIRSFADLARPGVEVLMPNPKTSGGAMWNVNALLGAAMRGHAGVAPNDLDAARRYLEAVLRNVLILDKGGRESMITFEKGVGDVAITYASEIATGRMMGRKYDEVIPSSTIRIDTPGAVVDASVDRRGTRPAAEAFLDFLVGETAQRAFVAYGFRALDAPAPPGVDLWTIDYLGGWPRVSKEIYGAGGVFPKAWEAVNGG
jgi:sulfate transport system substrate-binding protein